MSDKVIYMFTKGRHGILNGCVAAVGKNQVGYSFCTPTAKDPFSKAKALEIAVGRAKSNPVDTKNATIEFPVPRSIRRDVEYMLDRSRRYFKTV